MKNVSTWIQHLIPITCATALLFSSACSTEELPDVSTTPTAALQIKIPSLEDELARLTQKMQRFHNFKVAQAQGFEPVSPYVPHMGIHFGKLDRFDAAFILEEPELLLYVPDGKGGMRFVGVEYAVPVALAPTPPEGFTGDTDHWEYNPHVAGGSWVLHAWIIEENPDGVFAPMNMNIPATPAN